jgi:hypothetical protein
MCTTKRIAPGLISPNGDVPILFLIMGSVPNRSAYGLSKDKRGRLEINVVSAEMFLVLLLIVLESHDVNAAQEQHKIRWCTYSYQYTYTCEGLAHPHPQLPARICEEVQSVFKEESEFG